MPKAKPAERSCLRVFTLTADLEGPLAQALALARALDLMGLGLRNIDNDVSAAIVTVAEALTGELKTAKNLWRQVMAEIKRHA